MEGSILLTPVLADVNGDGTKDLVLGCSGSVPVYSNNGSGVFTFSGVSLSAGVDGAYPLVGVLKTPVR